ncbi:hypothetical protein SNEBB_001733 [Seison nebaliae]|nr:hypothetical protein SNEBB_001733 [Seison nebaliae]
MENNGIFDIDGLPSDVFLFETCFQWKFISKKRKGQKMCEHMNIVSDDDDYHGKIEYRSIISVEIYFVNAKKRTAKRDRIPMGLKFYIGRPNKSRYNVYEIHELVLGRPAYDLNMSWLKYIKEQMVKYVGVQYFRQVAILINSAASYVPVKMKGILKFLNTMLKIQQTESDTYHLNTLASVHSKKVLKSNLLNKRYDAWFILGGDGTIDQIITDVVELILKDPSILENYLENSVVNENNCDNINTLKPSENNEDDDYVAEIDEEDEEDEEDEDDEDDEDDEEKRLSMEKIDNGSSPKFHEHTRTLKSDMKQPSTTRSLIENRKPSQLIHQMSKSFIQQKLEEESSSSNEPAFNVLEHRRVSTTTSKKLLLSRQDMLRQKFVRRTTIDEIVVTSEEEDKQYQSKNNRLLKKNKNRLKKSLEEVNETDDEWDGNHSRKTSETTLERPMKEMVDVMASFPFKICMLPGGFMNMCSRTLNGTKDYQTPIIHYLLNHERKVDMIRFNELNDRNINDLNGSTVNLDKIDKVLKNHKSSSTRFGFHAFLGYFGNYLTYAKKYNFLPLKQKHMNSFNKAIGQTLDHPVDCSVFLKQQNKWLVVDFEDRRLYHLSAHSNRGVTKFSPYGLAKFKEDDDGKLAIILFKQYASCQKRNIYKFVQRFTNSKDVLDLEFVNGYLGTEMIILGKNSHLRNRQKKSERRKFSSVRKRLSIFRRDSEKGFLDADYSTVDEPKYESNFSDEDDESDGHHNGRSNLRNDDSDGSNSFHDENNCKPYRSKTKQSKQFEYKGMNRNQPLLSQSVKLLTKQTADNLAFSNSFSDNSDDKINNDDEDKILNSERQHQLIKNALDVLESSTTPRTSGRANIHLNWNIDDEKFECSGMHLKVLPKWLTLFGVQPTFETENIDVKIHCFPILN